MANVDKVLPFSLRSAPKLYNAVADGLLWILASQDRVDAIHYLDDFLLFGAPESRQCDDALCRAHLGVPVAPGKTEGPSVMLVFLGIQLDTQSMTMSLSLPKLARLLQTIPSWAGRNPALNGSCYPLLASSSTHAA